VDSVIGSGQRYRNCPDRTLDKVIQVAEIFLVSKEQLAERTPPAALYLKKR
jgi:hypothetical protein